MKCLECDKLIGKYNWKFCSIRCRNRAVSRVPRNTFERSCMICKNCGKTYSVRNSQKHRSKYCSRICQGKFLGERKFKE